MVETNSKALELQLNQKGTMLKVSAFACSKWSMNNEQWMKGYSPRNLISRLILTFSEEAFSIQCQCLSMQEGNISMSEMKQKANYLI